MTKENPVEVIEQKDVVVVQPSPMEVAQSLIVGGIDIAVVKEFIGMQREHDAYQAKKAYTKAMAEFKKDPPKILKIKEVGFSSKKAGAGPTNYKHADLGDVTEKINKGLAEVGISSGFTPYQSNNGLKLTCTLTHELGHSESISLSAGADNTGNKNGIQAIGSTISYLERYTLLAITGLATHDQDDDGAGSELQYIDKNQIGQIVDMVNSIEKYKIESFLSWARIETVELMLLQDFEKSMNALKDKAKAAKK